MDLQPVVTQAFEDHFGRPPAFVVRAPGRVNLIGEHTDYNDGYVLPMAIERAVWIALRPRSDRRVIIRSQEYNQAIDFSLDKMAKEKGWGEYIKGAAWATQQAGWKLSAWEGVMSGNVPIGAGLSSSSAVTVAALLAFAAASDLDPDPVKTALLGHEAEDGWIGLHGGIMDQMVSLLAHPGHALFLDCRTLAFKRIPLPTGAAVAVLDTATRRGLVDSAYNERRSQCDAAAKLLGVRALRDVGEAQFSTRLAMLDKVTCRRARHVVSENGRVLQAVKAMRRGDSTALGRLLDASHASLRDDFEVSSLALDAMVEIARSQPGCYGARLTGAGFAGCAIALVEEARSAAFSFDVTREYEQAVGLKPAVYLTKASAGASILRLTI